MNLKKLVVVVTALIIVAEIRAADEGSGIFGSRTAAYLKQQIRTSFREKHGRLPDEIEEGRLETLMRSKEVMGEVLKEHMNDIREQARADFVKCHGRDLNVDESNLLEQTLQPDTVDVALRIWAARVEGQADADKVPLSEEDAQKAIGIVQVLRVFKGLNIAVAGNKD